MIKNWLKAFRLRTLPLAFSCIIAGSFSVYSQSFNWTIFLLAILTTLFLQVLSNLANDYGDFKKGTDNQDRIGPERAMQSGAISESQMKKALIICSLLALITGISLLGVSFNWQFSTPFILMFILGISAIIAAIKYTVGKFAFAYHALGDLFVFLFFGIVGVIGPAFLQGVSIELSTICMAITIGAWSTAVLNLNNLRDHINDAASQKNTLVVKLGFAAAKKYHYFLLTLGIISAFKGLSAYHNGFYFLPLLVSFIFIKHLIKVNKTENPAELDPELKKVALSTFLFSLIFMTIQLIYA